MHEAGCHDTSKTLVPHKMVKRVGTADSQGPAAQSGVTGVRYNSAQSMKMTLGEANERITELDDLIFRAETGQAPMSWREYQSLKIEVEALMDVLARNLSAQTGCSYDQAYEPRQNVRTLEKMAAIVMRHLELHPEDRNMQDPLILAALHGGKDGSGVDATLLEQLLTRFKSLFEDGPKPPARSSRDIRKRVFWDSVKKH